MISRAEIVDKRFVEIEEDTGGHKNLVVRKPKPNRKFQVANIDDNEISTTKSSSNLTTQYKVRIPLIHGKSSDASAVSDSALPWARYYPLPGSQGTELTVGDTVLVTIVDFRFDDIVIIGIVNQKNDVGVALQKVQYLEMDKNAPLIVSDLQIGLGDNAITTTDLQWIKKKDDHIWGFKNGGLNCNLNDATEEQKFSVRDKLDIYKTELISQSEFDKLDGKLKGKTIYYIWDDEGL